MFPTSKPSVGSQNEGKSAKLFCFTSVILLRTKRTPLVGGPGAPWAVGGYYDPLCASMRTSPRKEALEGVRGVSRDEEALKVARYLQKIFPS